MSPFYEFEKKSTDGIRRKIICRNISDEPTADSYPEQEAATEQEAVYVNQEQEQHLADDIKDKGIIISGTETFTMPSLEEELQLEDSQKSRRMLWWGVAGGTLFLTLLIVLISTVFVRLTVMVKPRMENVIIKDVVVKLDSSVSQPLVSQKVVPAEHLEFSKTITEKFESSGREPVEEKARGKIKLYNSFSSSPQRLVASTRFLTESGVLFRLPRDINIPGAHIENGKIVPESIETELVADKAGEESNISGEITLRINGFKGSPKYEGFYAIAPAGFSGGFRGEARTVSADDIKQAEEKITKRLFDELKQDIIKKIPPGFFIVEGLREIEMAKVNVPRPKTRLDIFPAEANAKGQVLVFKEKDIRDFIKGFILANDEKKELLDDSLAVTYTVRKTDIAKGTAEVAIQGQVKIKSIILKDELAQLLKGKKEGSIAEILKGNNEFSGFSIAIFPPWIMRAPRDPSKILVILEGN